METRDRTIESFTEINYNCNSHQLLYTIFIKNVTKNIASEGFTKLKCLHLMWYNKKKFVFWNENLWSKFLFKGNSIFSIILFSKSTWVILLRSRISLQLAGALEGYSINAVDSCNIKGENTRGAFKITVCFLHHGNSKDSPQVPFRFIWLFLPEKFTITEVYEPWNWHVAASRAVRSIEFDI